LLGASKNTSKCKILNPKVLRLERIDSTGQLHATVDEPLLIENLALGYKIYYLLEDFRASEELITYSGQMRYEELTPENQKQQKKWLKNRRKAYNGSLRHFLYALLRNQLDQHKFEAYLMTPDPKIRNKTNQQDLTPFDVLFKGENDFERVLSFDNSIMVRYWGEREEANFWRKRVINRRSRAQQSWIRLQEKATVIDTLGHVYSPTAILRAGYWGWERVAEMLPWEYVPEGK
jgi:hypothetical protein